MFIFVEGNVIGGTVYTQVALEGKAGELFFKKKNKKTPQSCAAAGELYFVWLCGTTAQILRLSNEILSLGRKRHFFSCHVSGTASSGGTPPTGLSGHGMFTMTRCFLNGLAMM